MTVGDSTYFKKTAILVYPPQPLHLFTPCTISSVFAPENCRRDTHRSRRVETPYLMYGINNKARRYVHRLQPGSGVLS